MEESKLDIMNRLLTNLKDVQNSRKQLIERLASLVGETETSGFDELSKKLGDSFSNASQNHEDFEEIIHDFELERNRLMNES